MRDAFGGAFSMKLTLFFLMLYVLFMCVAINYARAFRVKNRIINIIEQNEGYPEDATQKAEIDEKINTYLAGTGYHVEYDEVDNVSSCSELQGHGYCIVNMSDNPNEPEYYRVETYLIFKLPIINVNFPIRIQGETRRIETLEE